MQHIALTSQSTAHLLQNSFSGLKLSFWHCSSVLEGALSPCFDLVGQDHQSLGSVIVKLDVALCVNAWRLNSILLKLEYTKLSQCVLKRQVLVNDDPKVTDKVTDCKMRKGLSRKAQISKMLAIAYNYS